MYHSASLYCNCILSHTHTCTSSRKCITWTPMQAKNLCIYFWMHLFLLIVNGWPWKMVDSWGCLRSRDAAIMWVFLKIVYPVPQNPVACYRFLKNNPEKLGSCSCLFGYIPHLSIFQPQPYIICQGVSNNGGSRLAPTPRNLRSRYVKVAICRIPNLQPAWYRIHHQNIPKFLCAPGLLVGGFNWTMTIQWRLT